MEDRWNLSYYYRILGMCEDIIAEEAVKHKSAKDYAYYLLSTYAKAILNTKETLCLLVNGFPDGALSRARDVYEQMVIAAYISENYSDELIKRYFEDYNVQRYKNLKNLYGILKEVDEQYKEDYQKFEDECMEAIDCLKKQYGDIRNDYWWVLDRKIRSFRALQEAVGVGILLVLYKRACISTHASSSGDTALLGRKNEQGNELYSGGTGEGFEAPILLLMASFDYLTQIVFEKFSLNLPEEYNLKEKYEPLWAEVFK